MAGRSCRFLLAAAFAQGGAAFSTYVSRIPNGANVEVDGSTWSAMGHENRLGGGPRNVFGMAFANAGYSWTVALCEADSDGDGASNGHELGDPFCEWTMGATPSRTTDLSHPGFSTSLTALAQPTTTTVLTTTTEPGPTTTTMAGATTTTPAATTTTMGMTTTTMMDEKTSASNSWQTQGLSALLVTAAALVVAQ